MIKISHTEPTPNPDALKFILNEQISSEGVRQFDNAEAGKSDPLAHALFSLPGVESVFYSPTFITVSKKAQTSWGELESKVINTIQSFAPANINKSEPKKPKPAASTGDELYDRINQVIDQNVKPPLEADGGGIEVLGVDGYLVTIHYQGACGSCPSATQGTLMAVENLLKTMVDPKIQVVSA